MAFFPATEEELIAAGYVLDARLAKCRSCPALVRWCTTPAGNKMPLSRVFMTDDRELPLLHDEPLRASEPPKFGYQSHFADCPNAAGHRKAR